MIVILLLSRITQDKLFVTQMEIWTQVLGENTKFLKFLGAVIKINSIQNNGKLDKNRLFMPFFTSEEKRAGK